MRVEERHFPPPQEQAEGAVVDATLSAIDATNATANSIVDAVIGSTLSTRSTRVVERFADVTFHDGLWRLVEVTEQSWLELDGSLWQRLNVDRTATEYYFLDDMVITRAGELTSFKPAGSLDHIFISSILLADFIPSDLLIDRIQCQSSHEGVRVTLQMLGSTMAALVDHETSRVKAIETTLDGGGRVTMTREYGDGLVANSVTMRHYSSVGNTDVLVYEWIARIESEAIDGIPYLRPAIRDGDHIADHRSTPTLTYQYRDACAVNEGDIALVTAIRDALAGRQHMASCGAICAGALVHHRTGDVGKAIDEAMRRGRDGLISLQGIVDACEARSVRARPIRIAPERVGSLNTPAILHLNTSSDGHFVVLLGGGSRNLKILDPLSEASAINVVTVEAIQHAMSGYAIELVD